MTLGAKAEDMNAFTQGLVLLAAAESLSGISAQADGGNQVTGDTMISAVFGRGVLDTKGAIHDMTINEYKQMALGYGMAIGSKEAEVLSKIAAINAAQPDIVLVSLTAPKQDIWISENLERLNTKIAIGIGGAFEVSAGLINRAPLWMQKFGLEWFYRFIQEPKIGRAHV